MIKAIAEIDLKLKGAKGLDKIELLFSKIFFGNVMEPDELKSIAAEISHELSCIRNDGPVGEEHSRIEVCYIVLEVLHVFINYRNASSSETVDHLGTCKKRLKGLNQEWYLRVNHFMADHYRHVGLYENALSCYYDYLNSDDLDEYGKCYILNNLGSIYLELKAYTEALSCFEHVIQFGGLHPEMKRVYLLIKLAKAHRGLGQHSTERTYLDEARRLALLDGNSFMVCVVRYQTAHCLRIEGLHTQALHEAQAALKMANQMQDDILVSACEFVIGLILADKDNSKQNYDGALDSLLKALKLFEQGNRKPRVMLVCNVLSDVYETLGKYKVALHYRRKAIDLERELHPTDLFLDIGRLRIQLDNKKDKEALEVKEHELSVIHKKNIRLQQAIQDKNELISTAAHDLKNPLTAIRGIADLLYHAPELDGNPQVLRMLDNLRNCATDTFEIVTNILDVNRLDENGLHAQMLPCALSPLVAEVLRLFSERFKGKGISISFNDFSGKTLALVDPFMYKQMLTNLISNALKYSHPDSSVEVQLKTTVDGKRLKTLIIDEGLGISEKEIDKLFERHANLSNKPTAGEHSSGLGLSITRRFAEINKGAVSCESTPGKGSIFTLSLRTA
jgi:signal transduction histidine kinase